MSSQVAMLWPNTTTIRDYAQSLLVDLALQDSHRQEMKTTKFLEEEMELQAMLP